MHNDIFEFHDQSTSSIVISKNPCAANVVTPTHDKKIGAEWIDIARVDHEADMSSKRLVIFEEHLKNDDVQHMCVIEKR